MDTFDECPKDETAVRHYTFAIKSVRLQFSFQCRIDTIQKKLQAILQILKIRIRICAVNSDKACSPLLRYARRGRGGFWQYMIPSDPLQIFGENLEYLQPFLL